MPLEQRGSHPVSAWHYSLRIAGRTFGLAAVAIMLGCAMEVADRLGFDMAVERMPGRALSGLPILLFLISWANSLVGLVLGLASLTQPVQRKPSAVWGIALNGLFFFSVVALLMLTWEGGRLP
jgi:hypothetical protein